MNSKVWGRLLSVMRNSLPFFCVYPKAPPQSSRTSPDLLKGMDLIPAVFEAVGSSFFPLGKVGMELLTKAMYGWFIVDGVHLDNAVGVALSRRRNSQMVCASSSNSVGFAISSPGLRCVAALPWIKFEKEDCNSVNVALS